MIVEQNLFRGSERVLSESAYQRAWRQFHPDAMRRVGCFYNFVLFDISASMLGHAEDAVRHHMPQMRTPFVRTLEGDREASLAEAIAAVQLNPTLEVCVFTPDGNIQLYFGSFRRPSSETVDIEVAIASNGFEPEQPDAYFRRCFAMVCDFVRRLQPEGVAFFGGECWNERLRTEDATEILWRRAPS